MGKQSMTVYSIGWLAILTKRHPGTMRNWESNGLLPKPIFDKQIDDVYRYYTAGELMGYTKIVTSFRREPGKPFPKDLKNRLHEFRMKLKEQMKIRPEIIVLKLANEEQIEEALKNNVDKRQRRTAKEILTASGYDTIIATPNENKT